MERRGLRAARGKRLVVQPAVATDHEMRARADLRVEPDAELVFVSRGGQVRNVEGRVLTRERDGLRLPLGLVIPEEMRAIPLDRSAERRAELLIRILQLASGDEIGRLEAIVPEVAGERAGKGIGSGLGDRIHLESAASSLQRVEAIGGHFELADGIAAEAGLPARALALGVGDLLTVDVELKDRAGVFAFDRRIEQSSRSIGCPARAT